ncbi:hypothetical protein M427DRAFT_144166 [Gonapodya prolifera JEL478]|uniref:Nuclear speckle splicing regulatory protein 1 N-terminal domain-containing protein n=1 Tax=Gonapodya prolifera (strain JEL478) TaxID=1344416 RepID=A0A139ALU2_GONPJ|nr:hypothetical protein M427DRAFT_144166 [Gonapodya prolifera JEL478]|eukprot:KXS17746.1 hypothetical protein M427DRAFT_144166 [Gonapodya prolifera JEL478]
MSNQNSGLAFGLNITKKKPVIGPTLPSSGPGARPPQKTVLNLPQKRKAASALLLGGHDDDDAVGSANGRPLTDKDRARAEIRAAQKKSEDRTRIELEKALEEVDPSIFDYDAAYDDLKAAEREAKKKKGAVEEEKEKGRKQPRYIGALLRAADQRKIDLLQATERKIQREREAEGDEFGDTEKFVTGAYKQTIEDMRRTEEEERKRAESEDVTRKKDLTGFYRSLLDETTRVVEVPVKGTVKAAGAGSSAAAPGERTDDASGDKDNDGTRPRPPPGVLVNDSDEIVDKRQLLAGGLNISSSRTKTAAQLDREDREERARSAGAAASAARARDEERRRRMEEAERTAAYVEAQRREVLEREREKREKEVQGLKEITQRRTTETAAEEARRRFLERKNAVGGGLGLEDSDED